MIPLPARIVLTAGALIVVAAGAAVALTAAALHNLWGYDDEDTPDTVRQAWMEKRRNRR